MDSTTPSKAFLSTISNSKITRKASSLLSQLRIGHIPLNGFLYKFKLVDSPRYPACGAAMETIPNFLLTCPSYAHERRPLKQKLRKTPTVKDLLENQKLTLHLLNYIDATRRFNHNGEY
jgi:hypothetical protein